MCSLQEKNSALALENESQREQYERCLDEVSADLVHLKAHSRAPYDAPDVLLTLRSSRVFIEFVFEFM